MSSTVERAGVIPATLSFLAIYNPTLSASDETFEDQIVYYYSNPDDGRRRARQGRGAGEVHESKDEKNEKLRQIGLAQGMVGFANNFSNGKAVDSIETEKSRIILHELETDWWLLASVGLTRLPSSSNTLAQTQSQRSEIPIEYSARELCPPALLLQQILRAHQVFLLHQAPSIADLFARIPRPKFCGILKRFWDGFIWSWDVLLHGNPAVDVFNGIKLAAGGELGIGVGEEAWGSGEREVLEGFIARTEGLVDLVVSRFGDAPGSTRSPSTSSSPKPSSRDINLDWQISGDYPGPSDGIVFSGIGALARSSVKSISSWMEWLYMHGQDAYGVRDNPTSAPRRKRKKIQSSALEHTRPGSKLQRQASSFQVMNTEQKDSKGAPNGSPEVPTGIPPSIVASDRARPATNASSIFRENEQLRKGEQRQTETTIDDSTSGTETFMKYLTLGVYGSTWGIPSRRPPTHRRVSSLRKDENGINSKTSTSDKAKATGELDTPGGYFLIGLQGEIEEGVQEEATDQDVEPGSDAANVPDGTGSNNRVVMRTLHVKRAKRKAPESNNASIEDITALNNEHYDRLRVVVYVQQPFIFTFIFELQTDSLAMPSFYRSLHHQLGPLQRPLLESTSPSKVSERIWEAAAPKSTTSTTSTQPIYDLVYDPVRLSIHTTLPNIPEPGPGSTIGSRVAVAAWTRVEALSVHSQILNTYTSTRRHTSELERSCKSSRGWWVVWMRLPHTRDEQNTSSSTFGEALLIRKSSDYVAPAARKPSGRFGKDVGGSSASGGWGPGKLAEGIGIDARQYIDGLLSLNR